MNIFIGFVILALASSTLSAPNPLRYLPALKHEHIRDEFGQYALRYVTAEGTIVSEKGQLIPSPDGTGHVMIMEGEVTYIGDDGKTYLTKYTAGLDGVKVEGDHLPIAPTVPPTDASAVTVDTNAASTDPPTAPVVTISDASAGPLKTATVAA